jgi:hypothetical protein
MPVATLCSSIYKLFIIMPSCFVINVDLVRDFLTIFRRRRKKVFFLNDDPPMNKAETKATNAYWKWMDL